jgi:hypothetical protein
MQLQFVAVTFIDVEVGNRVVLQGRHLTVLTCSIMKHDNPQCFEYSLDLGWPREWQHVDTGNVAVNIDANSRIMSWRTSGFTPFDIETMRGTATESPLAMLHRWIEETGAGDRVDRPSLIHVEVEAMDWPEVIGE